jgi:hypothetical protein
VRALTGLAGRLYTQLDISQTGSLAASRQASDPSFAESGGQVDVHSITPEEVLEQANRIFAPYKLSFAAPLSWFAVWKSTSLLSAYLETQETLALTPAQSASASLDLSPPTTNASI